MFSIIKGNFLDKINKYQKNINFAVAVALTKTAKTIQGQVVKNLKEKFVLRNTWTARGIRIKPATKTDLESEVYSLDWYIDEHDQGGTRKPTEVKEKIFWVVAVKHQTIINSNKVIPKKYRPSNILRQNINGNRPFKNKLKSGAQIIAVRETKNTHPITPLYIGVDQAIHIKGRKFFESDSKKIYNNEFEKNLDDAKKKYCE